MLPIHSWVWGLPLKYSQLPRNTSSKKSESPWSHQLSIALQLGEGLWTLPTLCQNVDWLNLVYVPWRCHGGYVVISGPAMSGRHCPVPVLPGLWFFQFFHYLMWWSLSLDKRCDIDVPAVTSTDYHSLHPDRYWVNHHKLQTITFTFYLLPVLTPPSSARWRLMVTSLPTVMKDRHL